MEKKLIYLIIALGIFCSCEEVITLDIPEKNPKIVVEGLVTNEDTLYYVRLSRTTKYSFVFNKSIDNNESGALIIITDNQGIVDTLQEVTTGIYRTVVTKGVVGNSYKIDIYLKSGTHYRSDMEEMLEVPPIDTVYCERDKNDKDPVNLMNYRYRIYLDWKDPANEKNYYLRNMSYYWDNKWHDNIQWNRAFEDKYINGVQQVKELIEEGYGGYGWLQKVSHYSLSKKAYKFWSLLQEQTVESDNDLANSSTPLTGNVYNVDNPYDFALGYFQVSAKTEATVYLYK